MKRYQLFPTIAVCLLGKTTVSAQPYDFQNTKLKDDKRVELFLKHLTLDEKMQWLSPMLGAPRLGIPVTSSNFDERLMRSLIVSSRKANVNPEDYEARSNIMWTATWARASEMDGRGWCGDIGIDIGGSTTFVCRGGETDQ